MKKHVPYRGAQFTKSRWSVDHGIVHHRNRAQMYRAFLQMMRLLPDPQLWVWFIPRFRQMCAYKPPAVNRVPEEPINEGTVEELQQKYREWREEIRRIQVVDEERASQLKQTRTMLNLIRAAVACHPHVLVRTIQEAYGQRGELSYKIERRVAQQSVPIGRTADQDRLLGPNRPALPTALAPLAPRPRKGNSQSSARAIENEPPNQGKRQNIMEWKRDWDNTTPPIAFPKGSGVTTGFENEGVVETLRAFAGLGDNLVEGHYHASGSGSSSRRLPERIPQAAKPVIIGPDLRSLPSYHRLTPVMQKIFPIKLKPTLREPPYPRPPRHETRQQKKLWGHPVPLTNRVLRMAYENIWHRLEWVRPLDRSPDSQWVKCSYEEMKAWENGVDLPRPKGSTRKQESSNLPPERENKWTYTTPEENDWISGRKTLASKERGWSSDRQNEIESVNEDDSWLVGTSNSMRWMARWEQLQRNGRVNRTEYMEMFTPTLPELQWVESWEEKVRQSGGWGFKGPRKVGDEESKSWKRIGDSLYRAMPDGTLREEARFVPEIGARMGHHTRTQ